MIVGVGGWRGIGASTTALLLAVALGTNDDAATLVETDSAGGVLAARLGLGPHDGGGLERLAVAATRQAGDTALSDVPFDAGSVRVIAAPGDPFRAWSCLAGRSTWVERLDELGRHVVVDLGRLRGGHPLGNVLDRLDALLIVSGADAISLATTAEWAEHAGRMSPHDRPLVVDHARVVVVEAPDRQRCSRTEVAAELGDRFAGWLPWDPTTIGLVERGAGLDDRRLRRRPVVTAVRRLASDVAVWAGTGSDEQITMRSRV